LIYARKFLNKKLYQVELSFNVLYNASETMYTKHRKYYFRERDLTKVISILL
jgi:hypothetical protein